MKRFLAIIFALAAGMAARASVLVDEPCLSGYRSTAADITAYGGWTQQDGGIRMSWNITRVGSLWSYSYTVADNVAPDATITPLVSHFLLEVSPTITGDNAQQIIQGISFVNPVLYTADPQSPDNRSPGGNGGNPNLPSDIYAVKFDGGCFAWSFLSTRAPIWGDFYLKDGKQSGIVTVAWNSGFGTDPAEGATDFSGWIPTPDTYGMEEVPEPSSILFLCIGLTAVATARRRFRK